MEKSKNERIDNVRPPKTFRRQKRHLKNWASPKRNDGTYKKTKSHILFGMKETFNPDVLLKYRKPKMKGWMRENKKYRRYRKAA